MAGMFYSLEEAAKKLNKTEEELKEIVKDGKLREFRDGPNLLYKVDEVEALMSDTAIQASEETPAPELLEPEELALETPEFEELEMETPEPEELGREPLEPEESAMEIPEPEELAMETPESEELEMEPLEPEEPAMEIPEPEEPTLEAPEFEEPALEAPEPEELAMEPPEPEEPAMEIPEPEEPAMEAPELEEPSLEEQAADTDEILLAPETGVSVPPSELTDADTAITGEGISVLGETDRDYQITDDTLAETTAPPGITGTRGTTPEVPLEKIEEDVNLDSFGSGSGLLDLSLQADDTSLGGILDEIYTAEGEGQEPAEAGSAADVAAEAEQILTEEEEFVGPQPAPEIPALAQPYIELAPDAQSNTFGMLLFLPLVVVIYTMVVAVAGLKGVTPSILAGIQSLIWYIMGGVAVVAFLVTGAAFMLGGGSAKADKKAKKAKKLKKTKEPKKPKKEKKPKKAKKAKKAKS